MTTQCLEQPLPTGVLVFQLDRIAPCTGINPKQLIKTPRPVAATCKLTVKRQAIRATNTQEANPPKETSKERIRETNGWLKSSEGPTPQPRPKKLEAQRTQHQGWAAYCLGKTMQTTKVKLATAICICSFSCKFLQCLETQLLKEISVYFWPNYTLAGEWIWIEISVGSLTCLKRLEINFARRCPFIPFMVFHCRLQRAPVKED